MDRAKAIEIRNKLRARRDLSNNAMRALARHTCKGEPDEVAEEMLYHQGIKEGLEMAIDLLRNEIRNTPLDNMRIPLRYSTAFNLVHEIIERDGVDAEDQTRSTLMPETSNGCRDLEALFSLS